MLTNYLRIACRNLLRNKIYTFTNVIGLALGIASAVLICALVEYHLSFDNFHSKADRIYRVVTEFHGEEIRCNPGVPSPMGEAFRNDHSSIVEKVACVAGFFQQDCVLFSRPMAIRNSKRILRLPMRNSSISWISVWFVV